MTKLQRRCARLIGLTLFTTSLLFAKAQTGATSLQRIILPLELTASQPATLAVLDSAGHVAAGVKLVLSSGQLLETDQSGRAHFLAPPDAGVMFARIVDNDEREVADVVLNDPSRDPLQITSVPRIASITNEFRIDGAGFQGDADRNRISLGGKPVLILASSPAELILAAPRGLSAGTTDLRVAVGAQSASASITLVQVVTDASATLKRGKRAKVILRAEGTGERLTLRVQNLAPHVVEFKNGDELEVQSSGGQDNLAAIPVKAVGPGKYSFAVGLDVVESNANLPAARDFLMSAQKASSPAGLPALQRALKFLQTGHAGAARSYRELTKISAQEGTADFQALIRAAMRALRGN